MFQTSRIITKIKLKNMNKVYGLNIDMLRLCYEIKEPYNINIIKTKEVGEEIDFMYFYLRRIQASILSSSTKFVMTIWEKINYLEN